MKIRYLLGILFIAMTLICCSKDTADSDETPDLSNDVHFKGWGRDNNDPEGSKFTLPEGLQFLEAVPYVMDTNDKCYLKDPLSEHASGNGEDVVLCVNFVNSTKKPITLVLPPGLIFISKKRSVQNGILSRRVTIEVPAESRYFHQLNLQCMNGERDNGNHGSTFDLGPVTTIPAALELFRIGDTKVLSKDTEVGAILNVGVHDIGDDGKVSDFVWERLKAIPNR